MHSLPVLRPGDQVKLVAPASRCSMDALVNLQELLTSWQLHCTLSEAIFGDDLLCANNDSQRLMDLLKALNSPETKAVICVRGGYGSMRLLPELARVVPPSTLKLFVGMSDVTALHLFLQQHWNWPVVHGALNQDKFSPDSIELVRALLFGQHQCIELSAIPMNKLAQRERAIEAKLIGGNLSLVQASMGTFWQLNSRHKFIFLEEIGERAYRLDRMLEHLRQAKIFDEAAAIILGDFLGGEEPNGRSLVAPVLNRFAEQCPIPVVKVAGVGHGPVNTPLVFGTKTQLFLGERPYLVNYPRRSLCTNPS